MNSEFTDKQFNQGLINFLNNSPTPFHAVKTISERLIEHDFLSLSEAESWQLKPGNKYFVTRNDSSIIAFVYGTRDIISSGIKMVGAHTDSPCLKLKPNPEKSAYNYFQVGVEIYGGVLLNPWFDRDLSLAGRVSYESSSGKVCSILVDFKKPVAIIPSLAIHLDREVNEGRKINGQKHLPPVLLTADNSKEVVFNDLLTEALLQQYPELEIKQLLDHELYFYDTQPAAFVGIQNNFIASARLDNLLSCYTGLTALLEADGEQSCLLICNDHEEVGSTSACGANGPFLKSVLERLLPDQESLIRCIHHSMLVSADNAHAIHPNFSDKHDENHDPLINAGPVIKINANQRYATNSETSAVFRYICQKVNVPVQSFVMRSDMACGSTIGPITASEIGIKTIDIGVPTFAMHSIRELAGSEDAFSLYKVLRYFYSQFEW